MEPFGIFLCTSNQDNCNIKNGHKIIPNSKKVNIIFWGSSMK